MRPWRTGRHVLTILVDTHGFPEGVGGHHLGGMQGNWNGIIGRIELRAQNRVWIDSVRVFPDVPKRSARVRVAVGNRTGKPAKVAIAVWAQSFNSPTRHAPPPRRQAATIAGPEQTVEIDYPLGDGTQTWDEFSPALYHLDVELTASGSRKPASHERVDFGMRQFGRRGTQFAVNGKTIFLRGTHNGCSFPLTGHPPMDVEAWLRVFRIAKSYGINRYRFHTWTPPEAALTAADLAGVYLQPELPKAGSPYGDDPRTDAFLRSEGERILAAWCNHPSLVMLALGNEIGIPRPNSREAMTALVSHFRSLDPTRLYAEGSNNNFGNPTLNPNDDYFTSFRTGPRRGAIRGSFATVNAPLGHVQAGPPSTTADYGQAIARIGVPAIGHEVGQYTVYPDFREIAKYTGPLRLRNYDVFREQLEAKGMLDQADAFVRASGALAVLCYREEVETALRTPGFGGFQLLDIIDNQEQGTALVGFLDAFMDSKGLIAPAAWPSSAPRPCRWCLCRNTRG